MTEKLKKIWQWLDGKKTAIAAVYWFVFTHMDILFPKGIPQNITEYMVEIGTYLTMAGLGHKAVKELSKKS